MTNGGERFGLIKKTGREWTAEIRESHNGDLLRYAGIWQTLRKAIEECTDYLSRRMTETQRYQHPSTAGHTSPCSKMLSLFSRHAHRSGR